MPFVVPRILLVMPEQWPRALLRAALREAGYDAVGAPGLPAALRYRTVVPERGPVRLVVLDQAALRGAEAGRELATLSSRHGHPDLMLLARGGSTVALPTLTPEIGWRRIVRRPASIAQLVDAVRTILPLPPESARPVD